MSQTHVSDLLCELLGSLWACSGSPFVYKLHCLAKRGEWIEMSRFSANPSQYSCGSTYQVDSYACGLFQKNLDLPVESSSEEARYNAAIRKFLEGEHKCAETNLRLRATYNSFKEYGSLTSCENRIRFGLGNLNSEISMYESLDRITKFISRLLGEAPSIDEIDFRFGPGATLSDRSSESTVPDKISSIITTTARAFPHIVTLAGTAWGRAHVQDHGRLRARLVRGNEFFSVPKNFNEDRGAAKEPSLSAPITIWLGSQIKERLAAFGNNVRTNQALNQKLAREGSVSGSYATVDLRNASNTVSLEAVRTLFPKRWVELLSSVRSPVTRIYSFDRRSHRDVLLNMFSTMGCGFTFEVETLIFLAAARESMRLVGLTAEIGKNVSVHGDDVVLPSAAYDSFVRLLSFLGFEVNKKKSFASGPFRESCGGDFWVGRAVRPIFLPKIPTEPNEWITLANQLYRHSDSALSHGLLKWFARSRARVLAELPKHVRECRGPRYLGDIVIHDDNREVWVTRPARDEGGSNGMLQIRTYSPVSFRDISWDGFGSGAQTAAALYGTAIHYIHRGDSSREVVRGRDSVLGYGPKWITLTWDNSEVVSPLKDWLPRPRLHYQWKGNPLLWARLWALTS